MIRRSIVCLVIALAASACETPRYPGPMVQGLPRGFIGEPEAGHQRELFSDRILERDAYVVTAATDFSGIYIRKLRGGTTRADVVAEQAEARTTRADPDVSYGPIEDLRIDDRPAWGWMEETRDAGGLQFMDYRAVVDYDSVSYAIEFITGDPWWKIRPDSMRAVTQSFAIGRVKWNVGLLAGGAVVGIILLRLVWGRIGAKKPGQDYNLKSYKKPEPDEGSSAGGGSPGGARPDPEPAPPAPDSGQTGSEGGRNL